MTSRRPNATSSRAPTATGAGSQRLFGKLLSPTEDAERLLPMTPAVRALGQLGWCGVDGLSVAGTFGHLVACCLHLLIALLSAFALRYLAQSPAISDIRLR